MQPVTSAAPQLVRGGLCVPSSGMTGQSQRTQLGSLQDSLRQN